MELAKHSSLSLSCLQPFKERCARHRLLLFSFLLSLSQKHSPNHFCFCDAKSLLVLGNQIYCFFPRWFLSHQNW